MKNKSTQNFVEQLQSGDNTLFEALYDKFFCALCTLANKFINQDVAAADMAQDAFVALWKNRKTFESEAHVRAFLFTTTRNNALNFIEHQKVQSKKISNICAAMMSEQEVSENVITTEVARQLMESMEALPKECKRVLAMSIEGKSYKEIGETLNIAVSTVRNHRMTAVKKLKAQFKKIS